MVYLTQTFRPVKGIDKVDFRMFFQISHNVHTHGHCLKLEPQRKRLELRRNYFSVGVVKQWNRLPEEVVSVTGSRSDEKQEAAPTI